MKKFLQPESPTHRNETTAVACSAFARSPTRSHVCYGVPPKQLLLSLIENAIGDLDPRVERVWPDKESRMRIEWTILGRMGRRVSIFGVPLEPSHNRVAMRGRLTRTGLIGLRAACEEHGLLLHGADTDPRLPQLADCLNPAVMGERLEALGLLRALGSRAARVRPRLLAHKPGRRAVVAYEIMGARPRRLIGKTYRDGRASRVLAQSRQLAAQFVRHNTPVRLPEPLGLDRNLGLFLSSWCAGKPGESAPIESGPRLERAARILAALHSTRIDGLPDFSITEECAIAERWCGLLRRFVRRRADTADRLARRLTEWSRQLDSPPARTIHRDFYEKQLIWSRCGPVLLDLDTLAAGDPALDIGNFIGHMLLNRASAGLPIRDIPTIACDFVEQYRHSGGEVDSTHVAFYWASSLLRGGAIHFLRDATRIHAKSMWDMAEALLCGRVRLPIAATTTKGAGR